MNIKYMVVFLIFYYVINITHCFISHSHRANLNLKVRIDNLQRLTTLPKQYKDYDHVTNLNSITYKSSDIIEIWKFQLIRSLRSIAFVKEPLYIYFFLLGCVPSLKYQELLIFPSPNTLIHYGTYCGPGPDSSVNSPPIDAIDSVCKDHDMDYTLCFPDDNTLDRSTWSYGMKFPKWMNQIISIRGILPPPISSILTENFQTYSKCIHRADSKLVSKLKLLKETYLNDLENSISRTTINRYDTIKRSPALINHNILIPSQEVVVKDINSACAIGLNLGHNSDKLCIISSKNLFMSLALDLFDSDLESDEHNLN